MCAVAIAVAAVLWLAGVLDRNSGPLVIATTLAGVAVLNREFYRAVMLAHRRPQDVLFADCGYVLAVIATVIELIPPSPTTTEEKDA